VRLLVAGEAAADSAARLLQGAAGVEIVHGDFGDIWLRDTGPLFVIDDEAVRAAGFRFNGWGGKYVLEGDETVSEQIAAASGARLVANPFVLEGGAIDHDGFGTVLTTRQCLLNPNRNPGWSQTQVEGALGSALGVRRTLWLGEGLLNDHTDGHVDNLARFVAPGVVACPVAFGRSDPNAAIYDETARVLSSMTDARGAALQVMRIASPGFIDDGEGRPSPASHMNFVIANDAVICPIYDDHAGLFALEALKSLFPERQVLGLSSRAVLTGGGSFHCITQHEPAFQPR
jgi:agmatine deiminase